MISIMIFLYGGFLIAGIRCDGGGGVVGGGGNGGVGGGGGGDFSGGGARDVEGGGERVVVVHGRGRGHVEAVREGHRRGIEGCVVVVAVAVIQCVQAQGMGVHRSEREGVVVEWIVRSV